MPRCQFSIEFSGSAEELIEKARQGISQARGVFEGNASEGTFRVPTPLGAISGRYTMDSSSISISVEDKPMLLGCGRIESELRKFMS